MECPICLEPLNNKPSFSFSECLHKAHIDCYSEWLEYSGKNILECPECNTVNKDWIKYQPLQKKVNQYKPSTEIQKPKIIAVKTKQPISSNKSIDRCSCLIS